MTTLQKTLLTATLIATLSAAVYEARQTARARNEAQAAQQQQTSLTQQIEQLQRERDEATNRLAAATVEIAQLKQTQNPTELLRLRGQVGSLRQQLASTNAQNNSPSSGFAKMLSDPAMREYINQAMRDMIKRRYAALFQELKLTPDQTEQFIQVISAEFQKGVERLAVSTAPNAGAAEPAGSAANDPSDLKKKLEPLLGENGLARFNEYSQELPARTTVNLLDEQLGASKLNDEQRTRLFQIVKAEPFNLTHGITGDLDKVFFGSQEEIDSYIAKVADSNQRVIQQAGAFLSSEQLAALTTVLTNGINARVTQAAAFIQKH